MIGLFQSTRTLELATSVVEHYHINKKLNKHFKHFELHQIYLSFLTLHQQTL